MTKLAKEWGGMCAMLVSLSFPVMAADIYRAQNPDGSYRYASQALDPSFTLYLQDDSKVGQGAQSHPPGIKREKHLALEPLIQQHAKKYDVDAHLVRAVIEVESNFNAHALSPKGAAGAMQLMPATAARYGVTTRTDPSQNIEAGVRYLKDLLAMHKGNIALALASYNAGEGTIARYGKRMPPYKETMLYVPAVLMKLQAAKADSSQ